MSASTASPEMVPQRRWLRVVLIASVAFNLLVIGAAGAAMYRIHQHAPTLTNGSTNLLAYTSTLPEPRRKELWSAMREEHRRLRPLRDDARSARLEWRQALAAEPFDAQRFDKAQVRVFDAENKAGAEAQRLFAVLAGKLTAAERVSFLDWQPANGPRRERRGMWRGSAPEESPAR